MAGLLKRVVEKYRRKGLAGVTRWARDRLTGMVVTSRHPITDAFRKLGRQSSVSIVQIGAFVGPTSNDPICNLVQCQSGQNLKAIFVEPVKEYFECLRENYKDLKGVHFENVAIAERSGERDFYRLGVKPGDHGFPDWLEQLGSLKAERMTELWDRFEADERIKEFYMRHRIVERIRCLTLADLLAKYDIKELDLLQIDTEGYDYEILKTIDFSSLRPCYINYECSLLGREEEVECRAMLRNAGYRLLDYGQDTFCTRRDL